MHAVQLGYPLTFVTQDFSELNQGFSFFPTWQKFEPLKSEFPFQINSVKLFLAWALIFVGLEGIILSLEIAYFQIRSIFSKKN